MIDSVSSKELYDKFHEFYIAVIKHIICSIKVDREDDVDVDTEMLHRVQEHCIAVFDELNRVKYEDALNNTPYAEQSVLAILTYTISSMDDDKFLPYIHEKYRTKLPEEEFYMLSSLFDNVCHQLHGILSSSCKFLVSTHDVNL